MVYQIIDKHVINYDSGRNGLTPLAIVDHIMQGSLAGTYQWFNNDQAKASAHFGVGRNGTIWQFVSESDTAWANGVELNYNNALPWLNDANAQGLNPNQITLSIEHEGYVNMNGGHGYAATPAGPFTPFPEAQYQATLWLHRFLLAAFPAIPLDRDHIIGHYQIDPGERAYCPGLDFPFDRLLNDLRQQQDVRLPLLQAIYNNAGLVYHPEWATHQAALRWHLGIPLSGGLHIQSGGHDYVAEVYAGDVIYYLYGDWGNIQRLNDLPPGDPLRAPLIAYSYSVKNIPLHPEQSFYQYADAANSPGGRSLGSPLSSQFHVTNPVGDNIAVAQIFALDTIYTPLATSPAVTNWGDVRRLSDLNNGPEVYLQQAFNNAIYNQLHLTVNPVDRLYLMGVNLGYGPLLQQEVPFTIDLGNGPQAAAYDLFGGGVTWRLIDGSAEGTLDNVSSAPVYLSDLADQNLLRFKIKPGH